MAAVDEKKEVLDAMNEERAAGRPFVLATVTDTSGSAPREPGAKMLVRADGSIAGTVGGGPGADPAADARVHARILAEILKVRSGRNAAHLRDRLPLSTKKKRRKG